MAERWGKLDKGFYIRKQRKYDISKVPDIYDSAKYDALHNVHMGLHALPELLAAAKVRPPQLRVWWWNDSSLNPWKPRSQHQFPWARAPRIATTCGRERGEPIIKLTNTCHRNGRHVQHASVRLHTPGPACQA